MVSVYSVYGDEADFNIYRGITFDDAWKNVEKSLSVSLSFFILNDIATKIRRETTPRVTERWGGKNAWFEKWLHSEFSQHWQHMRVCTFVGRKSWCEIFCFGVACIKHENLFHPFWPHKSSWALWEEDSCFMLRHRTELWPLIPRCFRAWLTCCWLHFFFRPRSWMKSLQKGLVLS